VRHSAVDVPAAAATRQRTSAAHEPAIQVPRVVTIASHEVEPMRLHEPLGACGCLSLGGSENGASCLVYMT